MDDSDQARFEEFVLGYQKKAFSTAYRITGNVHDAHEAVQEAFLKAFRGRADYRGCSAVTTWFHRIVMNSALDIVRRRSRVRITEEFPESTDEDLAGPERDAENREIREVVMRAVVKLPERQREIFILRHFEGFTVKEIGRALDIAEGTVKVHLSRAVGTLREELAGYGL